MTVGAPVCANCARALRPGRTFIFTTPLGDTAKCLGCALFHRRMLRRSILTALVVGTLLTLLNQGDIILAGSWARDLYWKVPLTYCGPFLVVTWGSLSNGRR